MSYLVKEKILKILNIDTYLFEEYTNNNLIKYSQKNNKYEINDFLQTRTMTIGIENLLNKNQKQEIISKMQQFSSCKFKLTKLKQEGKVLKNEGANRLHRKIGKEYNLGVAEADSCLKSMEGVIQSATTWWNKSIKELESKIEYHQKKLEEDLLKNKDKKSRKYFHPNYFKGKKKKIEYLKNKLAKLQQDNKLSVHYGKSIYQLIKICKNELFNETNLKNRNKILHNIQRLENEYKLKRLEYFVEGKEETGNDKLRVETINNKDYTLRFIFSTKSKEQIVVPIKIPKAHLTTFNLINTKKHAVRISYNKKGKLVANITYTYLKPLPIQIHEKSKGTIGIDIGPKEITCVLVKKDGNPYKKMSFNTNQLLDKRNKETERILSNILDKITYEAEVNGFYSITIENLNFKDKKYQNNKKLNRLLNKFPHEIFEKLLISKTIRKGIKLKQINPKYTSLIGIMKYSYRSDITSKHNSKSKDYSAALVIGRRGLGFKERNIISIRLYKDLLKYNAMSLLKELDKDLSTQNHCNKSNWFVWGKVNKHQGEIFEYIDRQTAKETKKPLSA